MDAVAIIGIGCRFPGGVKDAASYWKLLCAGRSAISEIPADRWNLDGFYDPRPGRPGRSYVKWGGFIEDIESFDPQFFGLSVREAEAMDPQQRLLLQVAYEAVQDARLPLAALRSASAGVFVGVSNPDYAYLARHRAGTGDLQAGTGTALSIAANRISHRFDLSGPSMAVDTACSSSLVALDAAMAKLSAGACGVALAGGANMLLDPRMFVTFCRAGMLSPTGAVHAFDARADGFVRGEGAGLVVLKRLDDAVADRDRIYAVIRATAVNQDGATGTITAPNAHAQAANIAAALARSGVDRARVAFVEAHGTGTELGDPAEALALGEALGGGPRGTPLLLGTAKANIGHLEPAAGIAGLIKAALSLHHGLVPPLAGFERPNKAISFAGLGLAVPRRTTPLTGSDEDAALVNASGFGGANACAILQRAPQRRRATAPAPVLPDSGPLPVPLSAASETQLLSWAGRLAEAVAPGGALAGRSVAEVAAALATQRDHFPYRAVVVARGLEDLRARLAALAQGRPDADAATPAMVFQGRARRRARLAFAFAGQGGQWWAMGRSLIEGAPVVRASIEAFDRVFSQVSGWSVLEALLAAEGESRLSDPAVTPAAMFALQRALVELWRSVGVTPDLVIGHSFGEVTAAHVAGCLSAEQIAPLVIHRGLIRGCVDRIGAMAAVSLGADAIEPLLPADGSVEIGAENAPGMVTLTGEAAAIDALIARLRAQDPACRAHRLDLDFAWHSSWLEPVEDKFMSDVGELAPEAARMPVISTVTGEPEQRFDAGYWWRNLRRPVRFRQAVERALEEGADTFIEVGPDRTLSAPIAQCAAGQGREALAVATLDRRQDAREAFACALGRAYVAGVEIDWRALLGDHGKDVALPLLPWRCVRCWSVPEEALRLHHPREWHPLLGAREDGPAIQWRNRISLAALPWLGDHRLHGQAVFPLAAIIEMMRAAAAFRLAAPAIELIGLEVARALVLDDDGETHLLTCWDPERSRIALHARPAGSGDWMLTAQAQAFPLEDAALPAVGAVAGAALSPAAFHAMARASGLRYGTSFQPLERIVVAGPLAWGKTSRREAAEPGLAIDPGLLDACLQLLIAARGAEAPAAVPVRIARVVVSGGLSGAATAMVALRGAPDRVVADFRIGPAQGPASLLVEGLESSASPALAGRRRDGGSGGFHVEEFAPAGTEALACSGERRRWIILARPGGAAAQALAAALMSMGLEATVLWLSQPPPDAGELRKAIAGAAAGAPSAGLIHASPLDAPALSFDEVAAAMRREVEALTAVAQALQFPGGPRALRLLTRKARAVPGETPDHAALAQSALIGLARSVAIECPDIGVRLIDVDDAASDLLAQAVAARSAESELVIRGGDLLVPRLEVRRRQALPARTRPWDRLGPAGNAVFRPAASGHQDMAGWHEAPAPEPAAGEVLVEVTAAGLNFRDVMAASGLLPRGAEAGDPAQALGLEFAGAVRALGSGAEGFGPCDRVFGMARGALRRFLTVRADRLCPLPERLSDIEAATLPAAWLTAHHALNGLARLAPGETVLIHSAAGGVGLAAIALARAAGAQVLATAGSEEKRAHLRRMGLAHVFDSRRLDFAGDVRAATGGRGVDVVLNSLSGAALARGLACLAPYGRFIELGKRDIYADSGVGLHALRRNVSLHVVDLAAMIEERPETVRRLTDEVLAMLEAGRIAPLPVTAFKAGRAGEAFRRFSDRDHIGKIAVDMRDCDAAVSCDPSAPPRLDAGASYLVTGGSRGFGLAVALWLAEQGAGRVVIAGRRGELTPAAAAEEAVQRHRARIETVALDVADAAQVDDLIRRLTAPPLPLRGVVHAAVAYADAPLAGMTRDRIAAALAAKAEGALNLTGALLAAGAELDFLVTLSSAAAVTGWAGQSNYAAANAVLPALARYQRAVGLPGVCIAFGALAESGEVARNPDLAAYLEECGWRGLDDAEALSALAAVLATQTDWAGYFAADWRSLAAAHRALASPRLAGLVRGASNASSPAADLAASTGELRRQRAEQIVRQEIARTLRVDPDALAGFDGLDEAGLDSLSSLELRSRLERAAGVAVPLSRFSLERTVDGLARLVCALVDDAAGPRSEPERCGAKDPRPGDGLAPAAE